MSKNKEKESEILIEQEHIPANVLIHSDPEELAKDLLNKFIQEEIRLVKGRFRCFETPGASMKIQIRKYPGIPMFSKMMTDNEIYEIPLYVARHLNGVDVTARAIDGKTHSCSYPVHGYKMSGNNDLQPSIEGNEGVPVPIPGVVKRVRRVGFESLEFDAML